MDNQLIEVYKHYNFEQARYLYILLAFSASAILYALNQLDNRILEWRLLPMGLSIVCWLISLYKGIKFVQVRNSALHDNFTLLQMQNVTPFTKPMNSIERASAFDVINDSLEHKQQLIDNYAKWQIRLIIIGILAFVFWYLLEMYLRTYSL